MKKLLSSILLSCLFAIPLVVIAQDARFSQYYNNPVVLNPALTGNGIEYIRVTAIYRTQWAGMGTPFTTQGFAVDKAVNKVGIGAAITRNGAGDGAIRTLNIAGNLSYNLPIGANKRNTFSAGLQVGVINKSFDESKLTFDNQYNPDLGYDPSINSNEIFSNTSITRPDVNVGLMWQRGWSQKDIRFKPFAGFSLFHLTRPSESFIDDNNKAPIKKSFYGGAGYMLNDHLEIKPSVMHLYQEMFRETTYGTMVSYSLDNRNTVQAGIYNRTNDAIIAYAGYQMNRLFAGMSYDINNSELSRSGKGTNAFEISLTWSPHQKAKKEPSKVDLTPVVEKKIDKSTITETINMVQVPSSVLPEMILATRPELPVEPIVTTGTANNPHTTTPEKTTTEAKTPETIPAVVKVSSTPVTIKTPVVAPPDTKPVNENATNKITTEKPTPTVKSPEVLPAVVKAPSIPATIKTPVVAPPDTKPANESPTNKITTENPTPTVKTPEALPVVAKAPTPIVTNTSPVVKDSDMDGIPDNEDDCPYIKGGIATRGCPDSDGDGIIDMLDDCPMESGPATNKGCPDPNQPMKGSRQELVKRFDNILFSTGMTKITTDDLFDIIERAIDIMYADKTTTVLLSGHTDFEGDETMNMVLSQARTEVVKSYLMKKGIEESRIQTISYGESMPVGDNHNESGRKMNRRVEINIVRIK